jgi:putative ABC transport system permease protein
MGMRLAAGRDFHVIAADDSANIIINEALAHIISKGSPIGSLITRNEGKDKYRVVGVVKDFVYNDMYQSAAPLILFCDPVNTFVMSVRLRSNADVPQALAAARQIMKANNPGYPFEYKFVNDEFENQFKTEALTGRLSGIFAALAVFISCLGLFGLASFVAEKRTKEIGVRKVLGANIVSLWTLLSKDFINLVFLSMLISMPLIGLAMEKWLQNYEIHTTISWWIFAAAGAGTLLITLATVSYQSIKAALMNPVKSLRTE